MPLSRLLNRERELEVLEEAWANASAGTPQLGVVWGRRRVGKTFLLSHFVEGKRTIFFGATEQAEAIELSRLGEAVRREFGTSSMDLIGGRFDSWEAALRFFTALSAEQPLVVVLDEVPYLARSTRGFASVVQVVWDHLRQGSKLLLLLTGSSVGAIETMLGGRGALRGRPTLVVRMDPLDPASARVFMPRLRPEAFLEAYGACGGYPLHLLSWDEEGSTERNLLQLAATPGGILLEDAARILGEELPEAGGYARILAAVGRGRTRFSEIETEAGQRIEHPLRVLTRAGFVTQARPVGAPRRARPRYEINDAYLAFWFGVLYSDIPQIERGQGRAVMRRRRPQWQRHMGWIFEESSRAHAARLVAQGRLPQDLVVGRWWAASGEPCEVDVLGLRGSRTALLGEARWQQRPLSSRDLEELRRKMARVPRPVEEPMYVLWGRGGVDKAARSAGARGFDVEDVLIE